MAPLMEEIEEVSITWSGNSLNRLKPFSVQMEGRDSVIQGMPSIY